MFYIILFLLFLLLFFVILFSTVLSFGSPSVLCLDRESATQLWHTIVEEVKSFVNGVPEGSSWWYLALEIAFNQLAGRPQFSDESLHSPPCFLELITIEKPIQILVGWFWEAKEASGRRIDTSGTTEARHHDVDYHTAVLQRAGTILGCTRGAHHITAGTFLLRLGFDHSNQYLFCCSRFIFRGREGQVR